MSEALEQAGKFMLALAIKIILLIIQIIIVIMVFIVVKVIWRLVDEKILHRT